jgi:thymidylate kinase
VHPLLDSVSASFLAAHIRWSLLRFPSILGARDGGDVDMLVALSDIGRVRQILANLGFVNITPYSRSAHMYFVTYHRPTDCWLWLDIVTELSFGRRNSLKTRAEQECLARCQYHGAMPSLAPDDDFWTLLLHCILDKGFIASRHRARLQELLPDARTDGPIAQAFEAISLSGWSPNRVLARVAAGDWIALESMAPTLSKAALRQHAIAPWHIVCLRLSRIKDRLVNLRRYRGLSVALLGPDGAGKTTLMMAIQASCMLPVRSVYMGLTGGMLRYIAMLHLPGIVLLGRLLVFWGRYLLAQYHQARGRLVIFDRYIYDAMVPHPERLNWLRRASRWVDGRACPGPDLVLVLDAPGAVLYARKGEYSAATLEEWRHYFLALQQQFPQVEIIDSTQDPDAVRTEATDRIWQRYVSRSRDSSARANQPIETSGIASTIP